MSKRSCLLKSISKTIGDYRAGEIDPPTPEHVETWIKQFDNKVHESMLEQLDHVFKKTYVSKKDVHAFLSSLIKNKDLTGDDPCSFWQSVEFLDIQKRGNSQREMLEMFNEVLHKECGLGIDDCGEPPQVYLYLDDAIFTGGRIREDLISWIQTDAPTKAKVHVVTIAFHRGGQYFAKTKICKAAEGVRKQINIHWWCCIEIEDTKRSIDSSDVLRPTTLPKDELVQAYVDAMRHKPVFRKPGSVGDNKFFASEDGRHLLEQELLKAGARIRFECPYLNDYQRPLGNMVLETLGFGSLFVTFRNCPNNCPLAFWAGDPWYPLFPRKTN